MQWLKEIPSHWEIEPFGRHFSYGKGLPITKADLVPDGVAVISYGQIHSKLNKGNTISEDLVRYVSPQYFESHPQCLLKQNDFVFADTSEDVDGSGNFAFNDYENCIFAGYHTVVARPKDLLYPLYYAYLFQSLNWKSQIQSLVNGVKVFSINRGHLKKSYLLIPPLSEQEKIVSYLEDKTSKIDAYVAEKEKEILLLQELKQKTIADAVTKGLNPNVKMKDSRTFFFGQIPEHWEERKMKYCFIERSEKNHLEEPVLCATQSQGVIPQSLYQNRVVVVNKGFEGLKFVKVGDFVISLRSFEGGIEYAYYQGIISAAYTILTPIENEYAGYFKLLFKCHPFIQVLQTCVTGIREGQNINYQMLGRKHIPLPPKDEQRAIVAYIEERCQKIDTLVSELQAEIDNMKEYKQRLIADCVTGQVKI